MEEVDPYCDLSRARPLPQSRKAQDLIPTLRQRVGWAEECQTGAPEPFEAGHQPAELTGQM